MFYVILRFNRNPVFQELKRNSLVGCSEGHDFVDVIIGVKANLRVTDLYCLSDEQASHRMSNDIDLRLYCAFTLMGSEITDESDHSNKRLPIDVKFPIVK